MKAPKVTAGQRRNLRVRALAVATLHRLWATLDVPDQRALEGVISAAEKLHTSAEESIARTEAFAALHSMMVADLIPETRDWQISLNGVKVCKVRFGHTCDAALKKAMSRLYMAGWRASMSVEDAARMMELWA